MGPIGPIRFAENAERRHWEPGIWNCQAAMIRFSGFRVPGSAVFLLPATGYGLLATTGAASAMKGSVTLLAALRATVAS